MVTGIYVILIGLCLVIAGMAIDSIYQKLIKGDTKVEKINTLSLIEARKLLIKMLEYEPYLRQEELSAIKTAIVVIDEKIRNEDDLK